LGIALKVDAFGGMQPAVDARLLPSHAAATANNTYMYSGRLQGTFQPTLLHTLVDPSALKAFRIPNGFADVEHLTNSTWLEFQDADTDVLHTNVVQDQFNRFYWASPSVQPKYNTLARIQGSQNALLLGVPAPSIAPGVSVSGGSATNITRSYVYTWVTLYGEEGPPSPPTVVTGRPDGTWNITMSPPAATDTNGTNRLIAKTNIYRTVTGSNGVATYFFVAQVPCGEIESAHEHSNTTIDTLADTTLIGTGFSVTGTNIPASTTVSTIASSSSVTINNAATATATVTLTFSPNYADTNSDTTVSANNQLQSTNWTAPPTNLQGWVALPNGMIAGWDTSNNIWFCEPYRPHAWPVAYVQTVQYPVVGMGVVGQTLVIGTQGFPYWGTGVNPSVFSLSLIRAIEPCLSRGSIVSAPEGVYYASPNGLVLCNNGAVAVVTRQLMLKEDWLNIIRTSTLRAARLGVAYYAWGSGRIGVFDQASFDNASFDQQDFGGSRQGIIIEPSDPRVAITTLSNADPVFSVTNDVWTGEVFLVRDAAVYWLNIGNQNPTYETYDWRSRIFQAPNKRSLEAIKIYFTVPATAPTLNPVRNTSLVQTFDPNSQYGLVRLYADDRLVMTRELRTSGELMRIPSGFKADFYQLEIQGVVPILNVQVAESAKELAKV
jgi:hypothetical protein